jgi:hypothetical protein
MASRKKRPTDSTSRQTAAIKGKLVEMIVAGMHEAPNVKVEKNVRLPVLRSVKRKREIDVLVSGLFAGYPVRLAVECKNYQKVIDIQKIDAYIGKLQDVGIPTQHGIYVSAKGFTTGALERAAEVGIKTLMLTGLTADRLSAEIKEAIQSVIYLLPDITSIQVSNYVGEIDNGAQMLFLYDADGKIRGSIPDFVWKEWIEGSIPPVLGEYEITPEIPKDWRLQINGKSESIISVTAKVRVIGLVAVIKGERREYTLIDPNKKQIERFKAEATFNTLHHQHPVKTFRSESGLRKFLEGRTEAFRITVGRFPLPRVRFELLYWPLSAAAVQKLATLAPIWQAQGRTPSRKEKARIEGSDLDIGPLRVDGSVADSWLEVQRRAHDSTTDGRSINAQKSNTSDLSTIWEPIWSGNPILEEIAAEAENSKPQT